MSGTRPTAVAGTFYPGEAVDIAILLAFVSLWLVLAAGLTAIWLTEEVRVIGLVMLPTAIVAGLLVVYFDWRAKLLRSGGDRASA